MPGTKNSGGHNAKSIEQLKAEGTYRPDRHGGLETPEPPKGRPEAPKGLKGPARAEWDRMVDRLDQSKTLRLVDDAALYQYSQLFAETERIQADHERIRTMSSKLMREVRKLKGDELLDAVREVVKLELILSKQVTQLRQGHMSIRQYLIEFGMTPSARNRVKILSTDDKPKSKLLSFRGGKAPAGEDAAKA